MLWEHYQSEVEENFDDQVLETVFAVVISAEILSTAINKKNKI